MSKEKNVVNYYLLCNRLKDVVRSGWKFFKVERDRVESIAEHIYGVQMLALAMKSEYKYDIDIMKVIYMLAIHELGEIIVGDIIVFLPGSESKLKKEHAAVHQVLAPLLDKEEIENIFIEFDERKTPEAIFAYQCDKLEADIQCKLYDQEGCVDITKIDKTTTLKKGENDRDDSWSDLWISTSQGKYSYDENFLSVSNYIKNNDISLDYSENKEENN